MFTQLKKAFFVALVALSLVAPLTGLAPALAAELKLPVPELETLPNGLQLAWFLSDNLPIVDIAMLVKSGYRDDPAGKTGTAELVSSLLDRGAAGLNAQQLARAVEMLGASRYASSDDDTFSVGMHGLAPDAGTLLDLLAKLVLQPEFPAAEVEREHARILDRWSHIGDYSETLAGIAFRRILTAGTSYGRGSFLSIDEFKKVSRADVVGYHKRHFTPRNSILMVVGRVNKEEFRKRILQAFGAWQGEAPAREYKPFTDKRLKMSRRGELVVLDRPAQNQAQVRIGFKAPPFTSPDHYSLVVANALLGEYFNSRLNALIRDKLSLTYGISSSFAYSKDFASFSIGAATRTEQAGQLIQKTLEVLRGLKKGPLGEDEFTMAKDYLVGGFPLGTSTLGAVASRWLAGYIFDMGPGYLNEFIPKIRAVTREDVVRSVAAHFDLDGAVIVVAGNSKEIEKSLAASGLKPVRRVTLADLK